MNTKEYISSGIIESYILGLASPEEAGILQCMMKNNAVVKTAYEEAQKDLEKLADIQAITPPSDLKSKIWNKIQNEQTAPEKPTYINRNISPEKSLESVTTLPFNRNWKIYAAAASLLLLISVAGNVFWMKIHSETQQEIAKLQQEKQSQNLALENLQQKMEIISNPQIKMVVLQGVEEHPDSKATVYWDTKTKNVYLNAENLPKAPAGMQYQLWAIADGKPISAGMYTSEKDTKTALAKISYAQAFAITLEKEGGSISPTMENMFVMGAV